MSAPRPRALALPLALAVCFFLSGAGSLVLEVVWSRLLRLVFGTTTLAISTILVAYMAGLGVGGLVGGRLAGRLARPVRAYALVELAVGVYALAVPGIFALFPAFGRAWLADLSFWPAAWLRFALSLAVLAAPTVGMGLTLPFLTQHVVRDPAAAGRGIGLLYGLNTLGAVAGVFLATFALLPGLGVRGTCLAGAGIYGAVGALALWLARGEAPGEARAGAAETRARGLARWNPALLAYGTVGFTSLAYEVTWTRALAMVMGSSIYAFSCMLASFLLGIALGALVAQRFADRLRRPLAVYALGIAALGALSLLSFALLPHLPDAFMAGVRRSGGSRLWLVGAQVGVAIAVMFPPALALGALFPLLSRAQAAAEGAAPAVGDVYFVNTLGSALGALAAGFLLLPTLGLRGTAATAIALNFLAAAAVLAWRGHERTPIRVGLIAVPALAGLLVALAPPPLDVQPLADGGFVAARIFGEAPDPTVLEGVRGEELLYYRDGLSATVSVHKLRGMVSLHTNAKPDASTGFDMATQVLLGEAGLLFGAPAKSALVIGFASGVTVGSVARHPLERIDAVELEPAMLEASHFFDHVNGHPLEDPRVRVVLDDGRNYLATTRQKYDVIISEPSNPWFTGVANLFTREFFSAAHAALTPEGRLVVWFPLYAVDVPSLRSVLSALRAELPNVYAVDIGNSVADLILVACAKPLAPGDLPRWEALPPRAQSDLYRIGTHSTADLWTLLRMMPDDVATLVGDAPLQNTDDNLFVELRTPWLLYADRFAENVVGPAADAREQVTRAPFSVPNLLGPALGAPGAPRIGELALSYLNVRHDTGGAQRIGALAPTAGETLAVRAQIARASGDLDDARFADEIERAVALEPRSYDLRMIRARLRLARGDDAGALEDLDAALSERPADPAALGVRAGALMRQKRVNEARETLARIEPTEYYNEARPLWFLSARANFATGHLDEGLGHLERYIEAEPGAMQGWQLLEQAYTAAGRPADAARARRNHAMDLYLTAVEAERLGDLAQAKDALHRALELQPDHAAARAALQRLGG